MAETLKKSILAEGVATTERADTVGESLKLDGADITDLQDGRGIVNSDHKKTFSDLLGRVVYAKKIRKAEDCETPYQIKKFSELKRPFIGVKYEIWDDPAYGHKEAQSVGAIYRYYSDRGLEPPIRLSVEGKTLERRGNHLTKTKVTGVALTLNPCNKDAASELVQVMKSNNIDASVDSLMKSSQEPEVYFREVAERPEIRALNLLTIAVQMLRDGQRKS